jgi:hypothetical protein
MRNLYALIIFLSVTCVSCDDDNHGLTFQQFEKHLKKEMSYQQILFHFGKPVGDIGSGIHIYVYTLSDKSIMYIGYTDFVVYAKHVSEDGQLLHVLIE